MSGPKLSEAELEELRRQELERQRQERIRRLKEAMSRYLISKGNLESVKISWDKWIKDNLVNSSILSADDSQKLNMKARELTDKLNKFVFGSNPTTEDEYNETTEKINSFLKEASLMMNGLIRETEEKAGKLTHLKDIRGTINVVSSPDETGENIDEWKSFDVSFDTGNLATSGNVSDKDIKEKQRLLNEQNDKLIEEKEKQTAYIEYQAISKLLGNEVKRAESFLSLEALEDEIDYLLDEYQKKDEMDFIADQINQVMVDLGYSFVKSTVLQKRENSKNITLFDLGEEQDCSLYKADNDTGILIFTGDNGDVMMQMTNLGEGQLTDNDREWSYQRQIDFCSAHPNIVKALENKGVLLYQKNYCEPDRNHARKVAVSKDDGKGQTINRRERRRREAGKLKTRHRE